MGQYQVKVSTKNIPSQLAAIADRLPSLKGAPRQQAIDAYNQLASFYKSVQG